MRETVGEHSSNNSFKEMELRDCAIFKNGKLSPQRDDRFGFPVFGSNGIIGYSDIFNSDEETIIIGRVGSYCGSVYFSDKKCWITDNALIVRAKQNCNPKFLFYLLKELNLNNHRSRSGQPLLNQDILNSIRAIVPSLSEQKIIGSILFSLDEKIALNRSINSTLEAVGHALFKHWFVDFEFPDGEGKPYRSSGGKMVETELGEIPKGWAVVTVAETCESIFSGGTPNTRATHYWGGEIPWLSSGETRSRFIIDTEKTITEAGVANSSTRIARSGCTVIAGAGQGHTRGQTSLLTFESYINQSVVALTANPKVSSDLFLFFDLMQRYDEFRQLSDSHSSRGSLTTKLLAGVKVVLPLRELIEKFDRIVGIVVTLIIANLHQSRTLAALRDALLPKLMSGEIRIK